MHLATFVLLISVAAANVHLAKRSSYGVPASLQDFPYIASIQAQLVCDNGRSSPHYTRCTGSLIADGFVLTAAHCLLAILVDRAAFAAVLSA